MKHDMKPRRGTRMLLAVVAAAGLSVALAVSAQQTASAPSPSEFSYRAPLEGVNAGAAWTRVNLPAAALLMLQSSNSRDIRVFNGDGQAVPYAFTSVATESPPEQRTASYAAYPLFSAASNAAPTKGSVQVRMDGTAGGSVWVQFHGAPAVAAGATPVAAAVFDTRKEKLPVKALTVEAVVPANTPVRVSASVSTDLATWLPLPLRGRLFRFEGAGAAGMSNQSLELEQPASLEGRYLRLDWDGQPGVTVSAVSGVVASTAVSPLLRAELTGATAAGNNAVEWPIAFATPLRRLVLTTTQANTVLPVRILGRSEPSGAWQPLGQTVVYRLPGPNGESTNPPVDVAQRPNLALRVETLQGEPIAADSLKASVEMNPVQLVFVASGKPPFELAVGRPNTLSSDLAPGVMAATLPRNLNELPEATVGTATVKAIAVPGSHKQLILWAVLGLGVLVLAFVAFGLFRQLNAPARDTPA